MQAKKLGLTTRRFYAKSPKFILFLIPNNCMFSFQISNILFLLLPPVLIHLFRGYAKFVNPAINLLWVLLMVVGLSSAYFHATLSLVGKSSVIIVDLQ